MSENAKKLLPMILKGVAALFAVLALIFMFVLPGVSNSASQEGVTASASIAMFSLVFGGGKITSKVAGITVEGGKFNGALSIFGLVAFVLLVAAIVVLVLSFVLKEKSKMLVLVAGALFLVAGVCAFLITVAGTSANLAVLGSQAVKVEWKDFIGQYKVGVGAILFGIFSIISGAALLVDNFVIEK